MSIEKDWKSKTLDELENVKTKVLRNNSYLLMTCSRLRAKKPLNEFEIEDLRILIGQSIGLKFLVPMAIEELEKDILAEGDFYEGDLLNSVLYSGSDYWKSNIENWQKVCVLFEKNKELLNSLDTTNDIKLNWFDLYNKFAKINS